MFKKISENFSKGFDKFCKYAATVKSIYRIHYFTNHNQFGFITSLNDPNLVPNVMLEGILRQFFREQGVDIFIRKKFKENWFIVINYEIHSLVKEHYKGYQSAFQSAVEKAFEILEVSE